MKTSYKGKLLISTPSISGDIFSRAVVLVVEHDEDGAFGLILNRKHQALSFVAKKLLEMDISVYEGGPVEENRTIFIVKGKAYRESHYPLNEKYYLTFDMDAVIDEIVNKNLSIDAVKVFSGYSGWSRRQLEGEVANKQWIVIDEPSLDYVAREEASLWKSLMQNLGGKNLIWANAPEDVTMN